MVGVGGTRQPATQELRTPNVLTWNSRRTAAVEEHRVVEVLQGLSDAGLEVRTWEPYQARKPAGLAHLWGNCRVFCLHVWSPDTWCFLKNT